MLFRSSIIEQNVPRVNCLSKQPEPKFSKSYNYSCLKRYIALSKFNFIVNHQNSIVGKNYTDLLNDKVSCVQSLRDLFVCHVCGIQNNNLPCFSVSRLLQLKKIVEHFIFIKLKLKGFSSYVKGEKNYVQSLVIFAYITANMAVILNNSAIN